MKGDFTRDTFDPKKHYIAVLQQQGRVQLDADWNEQQSITRHRIETETQDVIGPDGGPANNDGFKIERIDEANQVPRRLRIGAGRYYVDGILCENDTDLPYDQQPDLPQPPDMKAVFGGASGFGFVYLDVWHRHVSALDDPSIREVALGGANTADRTKAIWQVKILPFEPERLRTDVSCANPPAAFKDLGAWPRGELAAQVVMPPTSTDPCLLPPTAGYRRLENQLYRVEIQESGDFGATTFKWSRDNGCVVTAITQISGNMVHVRDLGRDEILGFKVGDLVEISDDCTELNAIPGALRKIIGINRSLPEPEVILDDLPVTKSDVSVEMQFRPKLRRWDGGGTILGGTDWIALEDGIQVRFSGEGFRTGDYWLIPARTATGEIDWPSRGGEPVHQAPRGIQHHYCALATFQYDQSNGITNIVDCRKSFMPLSQKRKPSEAFHVVNLSWLNDGTHSPDVLTKGLSITFDSKPDRIRNEAWRVYIEVPFRLVMEAHRMLSAVVVEPPWTIVRTESETPKMLLLLDGRVTSGLTSTWQISSDDRQHIERFFSRNLGESLGVCVVLKGHLIFQQNSTDRRVYLDGQAFGIPSIDGERMDLELPSGSGSRASDFESWFYLEEPLFIESLTIDAPYNTADQKSWAPVRGEKPLWGRVQLNRKVSRDSVSVPLTSSTEPAGETSIRVDSEVIIRRGGDVGEFSINAVEERTKFFFLRVVGTLGGQVRDDTVLIDLLV